MCLEARAQLLSALSFVEEATPLLPGACLASEGTTGVAGSRGYPPELLIGFDRRVVWVDHYDLVELVLAVFADPIRVQNLEIWIAPTDTLLSDSLNRLRHCDLLDTCVGWLPLHVDLALPQASSSDTGPDHHNSLLGLVSYSSCRIDSRWALYTLEYAFASPSSHPLSAGLSRDACLGTIPSGLHVLRDSHNRTSGSRATAIPYLRVIETTSSAFVLLKEISSQCLEDIRKGKNGTVKQLLTLLSDVKQ